MLARDIPRNQHHSLASRSIGPAELTEETKEGLGGESLRLEAAKKPPVPQAHTAEAAGDPLRGVIQQNRIAVLRRRPQATARAILLEVHLIQRPKVSAFVGGQPVQFSLRRLVGLGPRGQPADEVSRGRIRTGGTAAGTAAFPTSHRTPVPHAPPAVCRPTDSPPCRSAAVGATMRRTPVPIADGSIGSAAPVAPLPEDPPIRGLRTAELNTLV
jgi:hypothetical protein